MSHMLDETGGVYHMGYADDTPWHGHGFKVDPHASPDEWRRKCIPWEVYKVPTYTMSKGADGRMIDQSSQGMYNLIRGDNGAALSAVSKKYNVHTISALMRIMKRLCDKHGFLMNTIGSLDGGKKIWALAKIEAEYRLIDEVIAPYVLLSTTFDKSGETPARLTETCVVCNNTLQYAERSRPELSISHKRELDEDKFVNEIVIVKQDHKKFVEVANNLVETSLSEDQLAEMVIRVASRGKENAVEDYQRMINDRMKNELDPAEAPTLRAIDRVKDQLIKAMANSPGHHLRARQMTPWGVIQGMTNVVDFQLPTQVSSSIKGVDQRKFAETNNRLSRSWFGSGQTLKEIAWREGVRYLKAA
jgi:phage/plasmid-like protein (TIGR03299 family)